jgi:hypothetical protein
VRAYLTELARRDFTPEATGLLPPLPQGLPDDYRLAASAACVSCHQEDSAAWERSHHAQAWKTLRGRGAHFDPYCQQCHTTGYGLPGGFASAGRTPQLGGVGCESCHGPAQAHVQDPKARTPFAARDQCGRCHDPENSPKFAFAPYWERIRHGRPAASGPGPAAEKGRHPRGQTP